MCVCACVLWASDHQNILSQNEDQTILYGHALAAAACVCVCVDSLWLFLSFCLLQKVFPITARYACFLCCCLCFCEYSSTLKLLLLQLHTHSPACCCSSVCVAAAVCVESVALSSAALWCLCSCPPTQLPPIRKSMRSSLHSLCVLRCTSTAP